MQLQQLKYFAAVIEHKSFSKAAASVFISQPSLSQSIQALEEELGFALLNRTRAGSFPTVMGEQVYKDVKQILAFVDEKCTAWQETYRQKSALGGTVRIACMPAVYPVLTEHVIKKLKESYPNLKYKIMEARNNALFAYVLDNEADMVLCGHMHKTQKQVMQFAAENNLEMLPLREDAYKIALSDRNPLARQDELTLADAREMPLACYSVLDDVADEFFAGHFDQKICVGYNSFEKIIRSALTDKTASVLPQLPTQSTLKLDASYKGALRFLTVAGFCVPFTHFLCFRKNAALTPEFNAVRDMIARTFTLMPELA